jgi:ankyrin repeat protein
MKTTFWLGVNMLVGLGQILSGQSLPDSVFAASAAGDLGSLQQVIKPENINLRDDRGWSPLVHACVGGRLKVVEWLLTNGANPEISTTNGTTPLHFAAASNHHDIVRALISGKANVNAKTDLGTSPLDCAAANGLVEISRALIDAKADVNGLGITNRLRQIHNVLMAAGIWGNAETVTLLLDRGADPNRKTPDGNTAFRQIAKFARPEILKLLLARGAEVNSRGPKGHTALMFAAYNGHVENVKLLLSAGADVGLTATEPSQYQSGRRIGGDFVFDAELFAQQQKHFELAELLAAAKAKRVSR